MWTAEPVRNPALLKLTLIEIATGDLPQNSRGPSKIMQGLSSLMESEVLIVDVTGRGKGEMEVSVPACVFFCATGNAACSI